MAATKVPTYEELRKAGIEYRELYGKESVKHLLRKIGGTDRLVEVPMERRLELMRAFADAIRHREKELVARAKTLKGGYQIAHIEQLKLQTDFLKALVEAQAEPTKMLSLIDISLKNVSRQITNIARETERSATAQETMALMAERYAIACERIAEYMRVAKVATATAEAKTGSPRRLTKDKPIPTPALDRAFGKSKKRTRGSN